MTAEERIAALEIALEDVLSMAEAHAQRLARTQGAKAAAEACRRSLDAAHALLTPNQTQSFG